MPDDLRNEGYLLDMVQAAERALVFVADRSEDDLRSDEMLKWAVVKQVEIIGEAATKVTSDYRDQHGAIPWQQVIGMRHRLVHDYSNINIRVVWDVVRDDLQPLIDQLRPLIPEEPEDET